MVLMLFFNEDMYLEYNDLLTNGFNVTYRLSFDCRFHLNKCDMLVGCPKWVCDLIIPIYSTCHDYAVILV